MHETYESRARFELCIKETQTRKRVQRAPVLVVSPNRYLYVYVVVIFLIYHPHLCRAICYSRSCVCATYVCVLSRLSSDSSIYTLAVPVLLCISVIIEPGVTKYMCVYGWYVCVYMHVCMFFFNQVSVGKTCIVETLSPTVQMRSSETLQRCFSERNT